MTLRFSCPNGHPLQTRDDMAGRRLKCPKCGEAALAPALETLHAAAPPSVRVLPEVTTPPDVAAPFVVRAARAPEPPGNQRRRFIPLEGALRDWGRRFARVHKGTWKAGNDVWDYVWKNTGAAVINRLILVLLVIAAAGLGLGYFAGVVSATSGPSEFSWRTPFASLLLTGVVGSAAWGWQRPLSALVRGTLTLTVVHVVLIAGYVALIAMLVAALVQVSALLLTSLLLPLVLIPVRVGIAVASRRQKFGHCPHDDCGQAVPPVYLCSCGARYADLRPNFYGLFSHTCRHGDKKVRLPTMDWLGRGKLPRVCRACERPVQVRSSGKLAEFPLLVVGGTNVGKSLILCQAVRQLQDRVRARPGGHADLDGDPQQHRKWQHELEAVDRGRVLPTTPDAPAQSLVLAVRSRTPEVNALVHLFDTPGGSFTSMSKLSGKKVFANARGLVLVVDPFGLPFLEPHAKRMKPALQPTEMPLIDVVGTLVQVVNAMMLERPTDRCAVPLAVVLSKADALPFEEHPFLAELVPSAVEVHTAKHSQRCRAALEKLGASNGVRALEQKFQTVEYFACTATGRLPARGDPRSFEPRGVVDPFLWLLGLE